MKKSKEVGEEVGGRDVKRGSKPMVKRKQHWVEKKGRQNTQLKMAIIKSKTQTLKIDIRKINQQPIGKKCL